MYPAASVSGWYLSHPEARYFNVGKLGRDQVEDYARRKGWSLPKQKNGWLMRKGTYWQAFATPSANVNRLDCQRNLPA